jgi:hypothetical protein
MSLPFCDTGINIEVVCRATRGTGIIASQTLWVIDFLSNLIGHPLTGLTDYMFMADHSLFLRGLSLFHGWLPFLLVYLVWRLGCAGARCRLGPWLPGHFSSSHSSSCRHRGPIRA